jgi:hypothetical protein
MMPRKKQVSGSFLKKRTKKLLKAGPWALPPPQPMAQTNKSFFASFCSQKEVLLFPILSNLT